MHVIGVSLDLRWSLQFIFTAVVVAVGILHLVRNTARKYFEVDASFDATEGGGFIKSAMPCSRTEPTVCIVCGSDGPKTCSRCKASIRSTVDDSNTTSILLKMCGLSNLLFVRCKDGFMYSFIAPVFDGHSQKCQADHRKSHKSECNDFQQSSEAKSVNIPLVIENGTSKPLKQIKGCLSSTRPLVAYLLKWDHRRECRRNDWCFLCELQTHLERASNDFNPFSPVNVLSRLPHIGGNLGYGSQEDACKFMRFAIDTMQSACLYEFGGKKAIHPSSQETTLVQHIFGGQLQSQVMCEKCNKISNQYENMMDLTVEIHGDAASLEECLMQFTAKEWLHGDNMYKCDACNDYVKAWKRLTVRHAPNILTVALKRFQESKKKRLSESNHESGAIKRYIPRVE
ncbi:hypothetical protein SAY87_006562 [Trapa incisa]|uniref:USP domain-containing protein n=1 Tax=Trapa incisa TaxID=236973 RepID=A0AAN7JX74_9MYRT|nr:hypothetical protein SAY87_006562 [Trapa incisa]